MLIRQNEEQFESLIVGLINEQFGLCHDFLDEKQASGLRNNLLRLRENGEMQAAGVGKKFDYVKNAKVRGDVIKWIENTSQDVYERLFLTKMEAFIKYLNISCYAGINDYEFHYAYYEQGSFYKRHLDQFKADRGRKFSFVLYLNEDWNEETDGGNLVLYLEEGEKKLYPHGGSAVFFKSDVVEHEVKPSHTRARMSIAGWMKNK